MEELRNSDNLKKEILEDARKKAERLLKASEKQIKELRDEWDSKTSAELELIKKEYEGRAAFLEMESAASIPLEKRRLKQIFFTERFERYVSSFMSRLSETEVEDLLVKRLKRGIALLGEGPVTIRYSGISPEAVKRVLAHGIDEKRIASTASSEDGTRGLVIEPEDKTYRFRLTLDEVTEELREYRRREIFDTLFKGIAYND